MVQSDVAARRSPGGGPTLSPEASPIACLGGSREHPRQWVQLRADGTVELHEGRICDRVHPLTNRRYCSPCPAYRGTRTDTSTATGLWPDGTPYALAAGDYELYERAATAALEDDDFSLFALFEARVSEGIGDQALRRIGDPDALERRANYMRVWRQGRPDSTNADRQRRWRARHRNVTAPLARGPESSPPRARDASARAREGGNHVTGRADG